MTGIRRTELLVIGAGPAGCATAIHAARAGIPTVLVDRARFPRDKICAEYMSPETLRHLDRLGALGAVERAGGSPLTGTEVVGPFGARMVGRFAAAGVAPFRPAGLSLPRLVLDHILVGQARASGVTLLEETACRELVHEGGAVAGAVVCDSRGRHHVIRARATVGADGLRSLVARRIGASTQGWPRRLAFVAHVRDVPGLTDRAEMHVGRRRYVGLNPLGAGVTNVALVVPAREAAEARGDVPGYFFGVLGRWPGVAGRVSREGLIDRVRVTGPFAARSRRVVTDGALLVGDAAEFFDPFTGEGICTALRGGAMAAEAVVEALRMSGPVGRSRLAGYERARRAAFLGKWAVERLIGWGMQAPRLFDRAIERLERRGWSHILIGVTGDFVPARAVLNPRVLAGMLW